MLSSLLIQEYHCLDASSALLDTRLLSLCVQAVKNAFQARLGLVPDDVGRVYTTYLVCPHCTNNPTGHMSSKKLYYARPLAREVDLAPIDASHAFPTIYLYI